MPATQEISGIVPESLADPQGQPHSRPVSVGADGSVYIRADVLFDVFTQILLELRAIRKGQEHDLGLEEDEFLENEESTP